MTLLLLAAGGAIGALCRYHAVTARQRRLRGRLPLGTLVVSIVGGFALGLLIAPRDRVHTSSAQERQVLFGTGICGAFATFSSFALELVANWSIERCATLINALLQPVIGVGAAWLGFMLAYTGWSRCSMCDGVCAASRAPLLPATTGCARSARRLLRRRTGTACSPAERRQLDPQTLRPKQAVGRTQYDERGRCSDRRQTLVGGSAQVVVVQKVSCVPPKTPAGMGTRQPCIWITGRTARWLLCRSYRSRQPEVMHVTGTRGLPVVSTWENHRNNGATTPSSSSTAATVARMLQKNNNF